MNPSRESQIELAKTLAQHRPGRKYLLISHWGTWRVVRAGTKSAMNACTSGAKLVASFKREEEEGAR